MRAVKESGDLFSRIREALPMREVAGRYGFEPNRAGFVRCPFHEGDTTPSLKLYDGARGWHCFGCGAGGDAVDFAARLFGIGAREAAVRLDFDFGLGLFCERPRRAASDSRAEAQKREAQERAAFRSDYDARVAESRLLRSLLASGAAGEKAGEMLGRLDYLNHWFHSNPWR